MSWTDGYIADVAYVSTFHREMTPCWLTSTVTALGYRAPDIAAPFTWCDLGCGPGLGTALTAASHPHAQFTAVDFNPAHVAEGRRLAEAAGLSNLVFVEDSFAGLAEAAPESYPRFDFIVMHGVYSWISPANRQAVLRFIDRFLAPGGIVYLNYMSHPGLSSFASAQRLMRLQAQGRGGPSDLAASSGLDFLHRMAEAGAGYFVDHPREAARLDNARKEGGLYAAHEFMSEHWAPQHVADVIGDLDAVRCHYLGSATTCENIDALSLPAKLLPLLKDVADTAQRETIKDLARNQSYRRDLYQRGRLPLTVAEHLAALGDIVWQALPGAPTGGGLTFDTRIGPVEGAAALFGPLLAALAKGPGRFDELARQTGLDEQPGMLNQALQMLQWAGLAHPLPPLAQEEPAQRLNRVIAERVLDGHDDRYLAAPGIGSAVAANRLEMAAVRVLLDTPALHGQALAEAVLPLAERAGLFPTRTGNRSQRLNELVQALGPWSERILPSWRRMGVLPQA
ncbi:methyltransferase regulatory domain-containing protein [Telmatospirillum sp. J64-1]|uniref:methyltransferase regulatory domain-containing protein n=1 Tax=Telmatospirillum sp. J64-1 TaxID=2502183 RepID=UPI00115E16E5|nr:methyltransferase regulatory domain-containing protein [Telmatospirillum sp. J64-1]